jgi:hypothetical protein
MASNVLGFLKDKNKLVIRFTGFLGKSVSDINVIFTCFWFSGRIMNLIAVCLLVAVFTEKILCTQCRVRGIFILLRAEDFDSAKIHFRNEVRNLCIVYYFYLS